jgi:hypothetical protein
MLQSKRPPSGAPARKDMPKIHPNQLGILKTLLNKGNIDVRKPYTESVNEAKYNYKQDAINAYMKGEITAKELDKISKEDFKSSVATKKELQNFLDSGYMKSLMANTYGLEVPTMEKKVKELMRFAESVNEASGKYLLVIRDGRNGRKFTYRYSEHDTPKLGGRQIPASKAKQLMKDTSITVKNWIDTGNNYIPESVNEANWGLFIPMHDEHLELVNDQIEYIEDELKSKGLDTEEKNQYKNMLVDLKKLKSILTKNISVLKSKRRNESVNEDDITVDDGTEFKLNLKHLLDKHKIESDEQLDEKLITFSNRAPYGQVVFMAGGAGSGKGFAISNFIDSAGFKVRDVDEMKKQVAKLEQLGKISVDSWYNKFGGNLKPEEKEHIQTFVLNKGMTISDIAGNLKNPNNVASLHYIVDTMGIKGKWLVNMLAGKSNPETLPNLIFDITAKNLGSITDVLDPLLRQGYKPENIHLIWVLTNFSVAVEQNKERDRVVPEDVLLTTHEGAAKTVWDIVSKFKPNGLNGRIDVILGGEKNTVIWKDDKKKPIMVQPNASNKYDKSRIVVKGFKSLPVKKQGGGFYVEKDWSRILFKWITQNVPSTLVVKGNTIELPPKKKKK